MSFKIRKAHTFTAGDKKIDSSEEIVNNLEFKVHKFGARIKPNDTRNVVIFPIFSEFGCETLAAIYCLPRMLVESKGRYSIVIGWHGRTYLYRHLVDEFWEIPEEYMWLREYARAFHHVSKNLKKIEKEVTKFGTVIDVSVLSNIAVFPKLDVCPYEQCGGVVQQIEEELQRCLKCNTTFQQQGVFGRIAQAKKEALWLPDPSPEKMHYVKKYLPINAVGIAARKRKTWGRNLEPIFYERLIYLLEDMGYNPVWIGEKVTSLECPLNHIVNYSVTEDANDLETTLALVKQMKFTIQFWTASTRLSGIVGTPYIIFESPDQIWGQGQEGMRLDLLTRGNRKLVISHFKMVQADNNKALDLVYEAVRDIESSNFEDIIGLVENHEFIRFMKSTWKVG